MSAVIVDGRKIGLEIQDSVRERASALVERGINPHLAVVIAGDDPASLIYVKNKERSCIRCGIRSTRVDLPANAPLDDIIEVVRTLNADSEVHGILVQSPAPEGVDELEIASEIDPLKDVDGFHPSNLGRLVQGDLSGLLPCTPAGVIRLLEKTNAIVRGSKALVIGRSRIVGMPMALMLAQKGVDATVTLAHSKSTDLAALSRDSEIIIAAAGVPHIVKSNWVSPGSFVVDVGISRSKDGKLAGDVDPEVRDVAGWITPVPGGVGPMTIAMLMENTIRAAEFQNL